MIRADEFTFQYPTREEPALEGVSFEVDDGDVLGVLGPIEAGKTTLAMAISSFAPQNTGGITEGELTVAGRDPRQADDNAVAMVFEDYAAQLTQVRVLDEVVAPLVNRGLSRDNAVPKARDLLDRIQLGDVEEKFTWDLSGGEQQRLAIAAALAIEPEVLVFDTATDMLDPAGREHVTNLIASMAGSTTLVVTANDPDDLVGIADQVLVLEDGERISFGPADNVLRDATLLRDVGVGLPLCLEVADRLGVEANPLTPSEFAANVDHATQTVSEGPASPDGGTLEGDALTNIDMAETTYEYADGTVAVNGVDLNVSDGEVHAVIGGNGAGKSTFSKLLVGLFDPDVGYVRVSGTETHDVTARELATTIGIALQNPDEQLSEETVEAELRFPLEQRQYERTGFLSLSKEKRFDDEYIDERVQAVRDLVGIDDDVLDLDPVFLPQGEQRLLTIAQSLVPDPDAVVLDEPTAGLDAANRDRVTHVIQQLKAEQKAVVLIDHDMDFICDVADRVTVLSDGEVVGQGSTEKIFAQDNWSWLDAHQMRPPRVSRLAREFGVTAFTVEQLVEELTAADVEGTA